MVHCVDVLPAKLIVLYCSLSYLYARFQVNCACGNVYWPSIPPKCIPRY